MVGGGGSQFAGKRIPLAEGQRLDRVVIQSQSGTEQKQGKRVGGEVSCVGVNGTGEGENIYSPCAVFEQELRDFVEGCARVEEVVNQQYTFASDLSKHGKRSRDVASFLGESFHLFLGLGLAGLHNNDLHGYLDFSRQCFTKDMDGI